MPFDFSAFSTPGGRDKPMPFWVWNGDMTREDIDRDLAMLAEGGFGGAFVHPRPGLVTPYLSAEWFALWEHALAVAKHLDLALGVYDENTYPTGYAGGQILSQLPDCAAKGIKMHRCADYAALAALLDDPATPPECRVPVRVYAEEDAGAGPVLLQDCTHRTRRELQGMGGGFVVFLPLQPYASAWYGGFPNSDILRPEVTRLLLESTYEAYFSRFGQDFGGAIPAFFSDEPGISPGNVQLEDPGVFVHSPYLSAQFHRQHGYWLEDHMACLTLDLGESPGGLPAAKVRLDYYCALRRLLVENFAQPVSRWCRDHGVAWTGHFLEEHLPFPWGRCTPSVMSLYAWMQWPGTDVLMSHMLRDTGESPLLLCLKELDSVGAQLGKERLLCECYGAGGWDASVRDFKRIGDWLIANGITLLTPHLTLSSLVGVRKQGHPQSFDDRQPWWPEYGELAAYYSRLCAAMTQGRDDAHLLILHPALSWATAPPELSGGDLLQNYHKLPGDSPVRAFVALLQGLTDAHIPFHLGDEFLLEAHGAVRDGRLVVGGCAYDRVFLPPGISCIRGATLALLQAAGEAGVTLYRGGALPTLLDGVPAAVSLPAQLLTHPVAELAAGTGSGISILHGNGKLTLRRRLLDRGELLFLCNSGPGPLRFSVRTLYSKVTDLNALDGSREPCPLTQVDGTFQLELSLEPCGSALLLAEHGAEPVVAPAIPAAVKRELPLVPGAVERLGDNVLVLDYCDLALFGREFPDLYVLAAMDEIYRAHGQSGNPWEMAIQYRSRLLEQNRFDTSSGFTATYSFQLEAVPPRLLLAAEHPALCTLACNGRSVPWSGETWLDRQMGLGDISHCAHPGKNTVTLTVRPFDLRMELQPVYLLGDFAVTGNAREFRAGPPLPLAHGGLRGQGLPFYPGRVAYQYRVILDTPPARAVLRLPGYTATALSVSVNGRYAGQEGIGQPVEFAQLLHPGENRLRLELSCSLKNLFGPFHCEVPVRNSAWPAAWRDAPRQGRPEPARYDLIDYGLERAPILEITD